MPQQSIRMPRRKSSAIRCWLVVLLGLLVSPVLTTAQDRDDLDAAITELRAELESQFRESVGIGFASFDCDLGPEVAGRGYFFCEAEDEEGDRFRYQIHAAEQNEAAVALIMQPASQLPAESRDSLEAPCRAFLQHYDAREWDVLQANLHPSLRAALTAEGARERLETVRQALGVAETYELETYGYRSSGRHELEYSVDGEGGDGLFRCGLAPDVEDNFKVIAFLVTAEAGSALQTEMLAPVARARIAELTQESIDTIEAPFGELARSGDVVEGTARLADGRVLAIRAEYRGDPHDFEPVDFAFQVLDVPFLVSRYYRSQDRTVTSIECPTPVPPDGTTVSCNVVLDGSENLSVSVTRRGGDYRMNPDTPTD